MVGGGWWVAVLVAVVPDVLYETLRGVDWLLHQLVPSHVTPLHQRHARLVRRGAVHIRRGGVDLRVARETTHARRPHSILHDPLTPLEVIELVLLDDQPRQVTATAHCVPFVLRIGYLDSALLAARALEQKVGRVW